MDSEIIKRVQAIVLELSARGIAPGCVELATQERAAMVNSKLIQLFNEAIEEVASGQRLPTARGVILKKMIQHLMVAGFGARSHSPDDRESRILAAAKALPELCDKLQAIPSPNESENEGTKTRQGRMSKDVANENLKQLLGIDPEKYMEMGQVELAEAVGCSRGTLGKTSAYRIEIPKLKRKRR